MSGKCHGVRTMHDIDFLRRAFAKIFNAIAGSAACAKRGSPPHRSRCPGVSNQYVLYPSEIPVLTTYRGGGPGPKGSKILNPFLKLVRPCWHHFSLLGASWAHLASLAAFVVVLGCFWCVSGRSGLDFGGSRGVRGLFWRPQGPIFRRFFECRTDIVPTTTILEKP